MHKLTGIWRRLGLINLAVARVLVKFLAAERSSMVTTSLTLNRSRRSISRLPRFSCFLTKVSKVYTKVKLNVYLLFSLTGGF